jgi:hypothetical protein
MTILLLYPVIFPLKHWYSLTASGILLFFDSGMMVGLIAVFDRRTTHAGTKNGMKMGE